MTVEVAFQNFSPYGVIVSRRNQDRKFVKEGNKNVSRYDGYFHKSWRELIRPFPRQMGYNDDGRTREENSSADIDRHRQIKPIELGRTREVNREICNLWLYFNSTHLSSSYVCFMNCCQMVSNITFLR